MCQKPRRATPFPAPGQMELLAGNSLSSAAVIIFTCALLLLWVRVSLVLLCAPKGAQTPRNPPTVPFLGCLGVLINGLSAQKAFAWSRKYGPVIRFTTGLTETVVLCDLENIKAFLNHKDILYRSPSWILNGTIDLGFAVYGGNTWQQNRRHSVQLLRKLGTGKPAMEKLITETCDHLGDHIAENLSQPLDLSDLLLGGVCGMKCRLLFNCRCPLDDIRHQNLSRAVREEFSSSRSGSMVSSLPPSLLSLARRLQFTEAGVVFRTTVPIREFVSEHLRLVARDLNDDNRSFVKMSLLEKKGVDEHNIFHTPTNLIGNTTALLLAGSVTVSAFLMRLFVLVASNVDTVQARIQEEIDAVAGKERQPTWEDRYATPYTTAVIWETHRLHTLLPLGLPRWANEDVVVGRHFVRKGSTVVANIWALHNDPDLWTEPEKFDPARFLNEDGSLALDMIKRVVPFSIGKRMCPGEALAQMEIYLFLTCLLQKFSVHPYAGCQFDANISDEVIMLPGHHLVRCVLREPHSWPRGGVKTLPT